VCVCVNILPDAALGFVKIVVLDDGSWSLLGLRAAGKCVAVCCGVLQCVTVCCSVLQCVAACCSVLLCVAVCCSVVQCGAVCCNVSSLWSLLGLRAAGKCVAVLL